MTRGANTTFSTTVANEKIDGKPSPSTNSWMGVRETTEVIETDRDDSTSGRCATSPRPLSSIRDLFQKKEESGEEDFPPPLIVTGTEKERQAEEENRRCSARDNEGRGEGVVEFHQDLPEAEGDENENLTLRKDILEDDRTTTTTAGTTTSLDGSTTSSCDVHRDEHNNRAQSNHSLHDALTNLCIRDATREGLPSIKPNHVTGEPYVVENDFFRCEVRFMVRTDQKKDRKKEQSTKNTRTTWNSTSDKSEADEVAKHFEDKKRMFEFQFRAKLKKLPTGPLFLGCELEEPVKLRMIQRALCSTCLNFVKRLNNGFHYSFGTNKTSEGFTQRDLDEGRYERTHLSFALESCMDLIIATKPGEPLPPLGPSSSSSSLWHESQESINRRKKIGHGSVDWNTEDTYTMALWSAYIDWVDWKTCNLPGIRPFSLTDIAGKQPVNLTVYSLKTDCDENSTASGNKARRSNTKKKQQQQQAHFRKYVTTYTDIEMSHKERTEQRVSQ